MKFPAPCKSSCRSASSSNEIDLRDAVVWSNKTHVQETVGIYDLRKTKVGKLDRRKCAVGEQYVGRLEITMNNSFVMKVLMTK